MSITKTIKVYKNETLLTTITGNNLDITINDPETHYTQQYTEQKN